MLAVVAGLLVGGLSLLFLYTKTVSAVTTPPDFTDTLITGCWLSYGTGFHARRAPACDQRERQVAGLQEWSAAP